MAPEDGTWASTMVKLYPPSSKKLKHILQLREGSLFPCLHSTKPSWARTNPPSNWQIQHHNRMVQRMSHTHRLGSGSLFHEPCSTIPSLAQTNPPASLQIHRCNCRDLRVLEVQLAAHKCGESCSTTAALLGPNQNTAQLRNCMDRQVQPGPAVQWAAVQWAAASGAVWAEEWVVASEAAWEMESAGQSALFLEEPWWHTPCPSSYSNSPSAPETKNFL